MTRPPGTPGVPPSPGERTTSVPVRVVLVDDHRMFRTGVRAELTAAMPGMAPLCEFVGEAPDVDAAVAVIRQQR
ncbi:MAG: hypothetical protein ACRCXL_03270, partial [Dermatophilaceae bacterium]